MRQINPQKYCGRYGNLITAYFGHYFNGPSAAGERLFIQSQSFLYCIGPAVKGTPTDDPTVVAAIRAESDASKLSARLSNPSAQYRFEAAKRLASLKASLVKEASERLASLTLDDPYEEIRGQAVLAMDASDPRGRAGWDHLLADYAKNFWTDPAPKEGWAYWTNRDRTERRHWHLMTLRALGEQGRVLLERDYAELAKDPVRLRMVLDIASSLRWRMEPLVKAGLEVAQGGALARTGPWSTQVPVNTRNASCLPGYFAAIDAASDPAAAGILVSAYPKSWELYPTLARHLKPEPLLAWLEPIAMESAHPGSRSRIFNAWKAIGSAAMPSIERVRTAMAGKANNDKLAAEYAKAFEELPKEMKWP
jgi:hypothetical protein